jgi:hypothetical protein
LFALIHQNRFGAYYYDSVSRSPPNEIAVFMKKLESQANIIAKKTNNTKAVFYLDYNEKRHQYGNTECGVFSMAYQIRWLDNLKKNPNIKFEQIEKFKTNDAKIHKLRNSLFRPNTSI